MENSISNHFSEDALTYSQHKKWLNGIERRDFGQHAERPMFAVVAEFRGVRCLPVPFFCYKNL